MTNEDFAAYWAEHETKLRKYAAIQAGREDVVDEVLAFARADLEERVDRIEAEPRFIFAAVHHFAFPFHPQMNYETYAVIEALKATGNVGYSGTPEEVCKFLAGWHLEDMDEPYHPVLRHLDLTAVDWWEVTLAAMA